MTIQSLYNFGNAANVSANNYTTLYNSGAGVVNPQMAYGNANVVGLLAVGTDGSNTIGNIVATGNISGSYFLGNGAFITGLPEIYGNANVAAYLASGNDTANIITTGNISGGYILGNGSQLTGMPEIYGNANVAAFLPTYTGNLAGGNLAITNDGVVSGNITAGQNLTTGGNIQSSGNIRTTGIAGNITGAQYISSQYYLGDGGLLSNVTAVNVGTLTTLSVTGNAVVGNLITAGNVSGNYILGNGALLTGLPATYSNANVAAYLPTYTGNLVALTGNVITTANISGAYILGNGSQLTGLPTQYSNANVDAYLPIYSGNISAGNISAAGNVTVAGNLVSDDITSSGVTVYGDQVITGNLTVQGNTTTINSNVITTNDKTITVANNQSTQANVDGAGIEAGNPAVASLLYNALTNSWQSNVSITPIGNLTQDLGTNTLRWSTVYSGDVNAVGNVLTSGNVSAAGNITSNAFVIGDGSYLTNVTAVAAVGGASQVYLPVKNTSGGTLTKGTPVYATGTVGSSTVLEVSASRADTASTMAAIGLLETTLAVNGTGNALSIGTLSNIDTSTYTIGQQLYVAPTGGLTNSRPTGANVVQSVGTVGRVNVSTGSVTVNIWDLNPLPNLGSGNVWVGNINGYPTETVAYGNANVATYLASGSDTANIVTTGNIRGGNLSVTGTVHADGNIGATQNLNAAGVSATGNIRGANVLVTTNVSAAGNITGSYIFGNGSQLTGLPEVYGNANVATFLANFGSNTISTTGNITSGNLLMPNGTKFLGDFTSAVSSGRTVYQTTSVGTTAGTFLTTIPGPNFTSATAFGAGFGAVANIVDVNNSASMLLAVSGAETRLMSLRTGTTANFVPITMFTSNVEALRISTAGFTGLGNANPQDRLAVTGNAYVSGNVTGSYFLGNGSQLTGITAVSTSPAFANVYVAGQSDIAAGNASGSFTLVAGTNITITTDAANNKITVNSTGGSSGGATFNEFLLSGM